MFDFVRKHTRILQFILVLLILPSFVVFGIQGYSKFGSDDGVVAKVGKQKIMQAEWDAAHRDMVERFRAQQPDVDPRRFDTPEFKKRSLEALVRKYVLSAAAEDQKLAASPQRMGRLFMTDPQFAAVRNPDGTPNKQMLEARGMSLPQFENLLRQELTVGQVLAGVAGTGQAAKESTRLTVEALFQTREVQWTKFEPKQYAAQINPTPEQLQAFYKDPANASWLTAPERADVQYVILDLDTLKQRVTVSEQDLRTSYEQNIKSYTPPEERRASHILIKVEKSASADQKKAARAKIDGLLAQVRKNPGSFAELAKKNSEDEGSAVNGGDLDFFPRGAMVPPFEEAAFKLKQGEVSDVVETDYGYHIIMLTGVRGGQPQPFEAVKSRIEDEARKQLAQRQYAEAAEKFTNTVYEQSDSLKPVADELKLPLQTMEGVLREPGKKDQGALSNPRLLESLFDAANRAKGRNTEALEIGPNKLISARIVKYHPAARQPYAQVEALVRERFIAAEALKLARKDAEAKMAAWKQSPDKAALPAAVQMSRRNVYSQPMPVLDAVLRVPEKDLPAWITVDIGAEGVAVAKINKVVKAELTPMELGEAHMQFSNYWSRAESEAYYHALQRKYKVEYLNDGKKAMEAATAAPSAPASAQNSASAS
ncbi:MAG: peptidylprolyl isomerase [Aquabacterium sp.]